MAGDLHRVAARVLETRRGNDGVQGLACLVVGRSGVRARFTLRVPRSPGREPEKPALVTLPGCGAVVDSLRAAAIAEMNARLDDQMARVLANVQVRCQCPTCNGRVAPPPRGRGRAPCRAPDGRLRVRLQQRVGARRVIRPPTIRSRASTRPTSSRTTAATSISPRHGAFQIIDAWPPAQAHRIARVTIEGTPRRLFVAGDRALVYSSLGGAQARPRLHLRLRLPVPGRREPDEDHRARHQGPRRAERRCARSGPTARTWARAASARPCTPSLSYSAKAVPNLAYSPANVWSCSVAPDEATIRAAFEGLRETNTRRIERNRPWILSCRRSASSAPTACRSICWPAAPGSTARRSEDGSTFTTVFSLDMIAGGPTTAATIISAPGAVYASADALYMSVPSRRIAGRPWYEELADEPEASAVHKFWLSATVRARPTSAAAWSRATCSISSRWTSRTHYLRIATTAGTTPDPERALDADRPAPGEGGLTQVGRSSTTSRRPRTSARSASTATAATSSRSRRPTRCSCSTCPTRRAPRMLGELKIPGFSTYMHRMDATHLLTIGYDADDQGDFAYFDGVLLQIFDVTDPAAPTLAHKERHRHARLELRGADQPPRVQLLRAQEPARDPDDDLRRRRQRRVRHEHDVQRPDGLRRDHGRRLRAAGRRRPSRPRTGITCSNWWTNATSQVKRSIIMDDFVFSISDVGRQSQHPRRAERRHRLGAADPLTGCVCTGKRFDLHLATKPPI